MKLLKFKLDSHLKSKFHIQEEPGPLNFIYCSSIKVKTLGVRSFQNKRDNILSTFGGLLDKVYENS